MTYTNLHDVAMQTTTAYIIYKLTLANLPLVQAAPRMVIDEMSIITVNVIYDKFNYSILNS